MSLVRKHLRIAGRVQGVGFRYAAAETARALKLAGFVRNCQDGTVEAVAEGEAAAVAEFVAWCGHGPAGARVTRVDVTDEAPAGARDFRIER
jgi:acylphosphatase